MGDINMEGANMPFSKFVAAEWVDDGYGTKSIRAIGDDGSVKNIPFIDCDIPQWLQYIAEGGTISGDPPPKEPEDRI